MKINEKILDFDIKNGLSTVIVHHYFVREFKRIESFGLSEISITFKDLEKQIGISTRKIIKAIENLEETGIIEVVRGGQRKSNVYKYRGE